MQKENVIVTDEWKKESCKLEECVEVIRRNIDTLSVQVKEMNAQTKEMYDNYRSDNPELHNELVVGLDLQSQIERTLNKNLLALPKPFFGRIDYMEHGENKNFSLYIGKNGIMQSTSEMLIVDWRAPIASVYYDSDIGESSYPSPLGETIFVSLGLKRTFEISDSKLIDYYDTDVIANDEFLTKYLGKNKEVVLGEIIATIQKEQNDIIRDTPWHNIVVQGVAGSGKTTVAMHRISYILYNYKDKFSSDEFYIIGSNKMLLNYITGVLPNLDVYNINQMTMLEFFLDLLGKDFSKVRVGEASARRGKSKGNEYTIQDSFKKVRTQRGSKEESRLKRFKGSLPFVYALDDYLTEYVFEKVPLQPIVYRGKTLYSTEEIRQFLQTFKELSYQEKIEMMNKRLQTKIRNLNEMLGEEKEVVQAELKKYRNYFGMKNCKIDLMQVYMNFINDLLLQPEYYMSKGIALPEHNVLSLLKSNLNDRSIDLYDLGMLTFMKRRLRDTIDFKYVKHIVIDEAQDFGVGAFYILKRLFAECTFTIMGDVSQNIHYDTGMNDWAALREEVFNPEKDQFYVLAKSYRNTVEISNYASEVLKKCAFETYEIEPIIRHGKEVEVAKVNSTQEMVDWTVDAIGRIQKEGYDTIAVICRSIEEAQEVNRYLSEHITVSQYEEDMESMVFMNGVMVLPIHMTKGLEFDTVILWNPDDSNYRNEDADAKLLYVAITRALHELHVVYQGELSKLLQ